MLGYASDDSMLEPSEAVSGSDDEINIGRGLPGRCVG